MSAQRRRPPSGSGKRPRRRRSGVRRAVGRSGPHHNLVPPTTRFVGRERELAAIQSLIDRGVRLVSVTGSPGVGKSRLVVQVGLAYAEPRRAARFPGGVWRCDASTIEPPLDEGSVLRAIAATIGVERWAETLRSDERVLIIIDGVDAFVDVARAAILRIVRMHRSTFVVAASCERLDSADEHVVELNRLSTEEAVALWNDRVAAVREVSTTLCPRQLVTLVESLGCLPAAIEAGARQTDLLSIDALTAGDALDCPEIRRAFDRLPRRSQRALSACALFAGEFSLDAALRAVDSSAENALELIRLLRRGSLLSVRDDEAGKRFWLSRPLRAVARAALESTEADAARRRIADHYASLVNAAIVSWDRGAPAALASVAQERQQLEAILRQGSTATIRVQVATGLAALSRPEVARRCLEAALSDRALLSVGRCASQRRIVARARLAVAIASREIGDLDAANVHLSESLTETVALRGRIHLELGDVSLERDDLRQAQCHYQLAHKHLHARDERRWVALGACGSALLRLLARGPEGGDERFESGVGLLEAVGDGPQLLTALTHIAWHSARYGHAETATRMMARARALPKDATTEWTKPNARLQGASAMLLHQRCAIACAIKRYEQALVEAAGLGHVADAARMQLLASVARHEAGDLNGAFQGYRDVLKRLSVLGKHRTLECSARAMLAIAQYDRGDVSAAEAALRQAERLVAPHTAALLAIARSHLTGDAAYDPAYDSAPDGHGLVTMRAAQLVGTRTRAFKSVLTVEATGRWLRAGQSELVRCDNHRAVRALLVAFVERHAAAPGEALSRRELIDIAWPGETILENAARNRLRVALTRLRKMGLKDLLLRTGDGYALDASCQLLLVEDE